MIVSCLSEKPIAQSIFLFFKEQYFMLSAMIYTKLA